MAALPHMAYDQSLPETGETWSSCPEEQTLGTFNTAIMKETGNTKDVVEKEDGGIL